MIHHIHNGSEKDGDFHKMLMEDEKWHVQMFFHRKKLGSGIQKILDVTKTEKSHNFLFPEDS